MSVTAQGPGTKSLLWGWHTAELLVSLEWILAPYTGLGKNWLDGSEVRMFDLHLLKDEKAKHFLFPVDFT